MHTIKRLIFLNRHPPLNNSLGVSDSIAISDGIILTRCGKTRCLSIVAPTITRNSFLLPLKTDYPTAEISVVGRLDENSNVGIIVVKTTGEVLHIKISGATANFNAASRYTATWMVA